MNFCAGHNLHFLSLKTVRCARKMSKWTYFIVKKMIFSCFDLLFTEFPKWSELGPWPNSDHLGLIPITQKSMKIQLLHFIVLLVLFFQPFSDHCRILPSQYHWLIRYFCFQRWVTFKVQYHISYHACLSSGILVGRNI